MSVEDIQKVNKLAQELLNQGICSDRQTAVQRAEEMLNKSLAQPKVQESIVVSNGQDDNFKMLFDRFREYTQKQMQVFKQELQFLHSEIAALKSQLNAKVIKPETPKHVNPVTPKKTESAEPHPKRGNFNSDDVSMEKIFYYGNK